MTSPRKTYGVAVERQSRHGHLAWHLYLAPREAASFLRSQGRSLSRAQPRPAAFKRNITGSNRRVETAVVEGLRMLSVAASPVTEGVFMRYWDKGKMFLVITLAISKAARRRTWWRRTTLYGRRGKRWVMKIGGNLVWAVEGWYILIYIDG